MLGKELVAKIREECTYRGPSRNDFVNTNGVLDKVEAIILREMPDVPEPPKAEALYAKRKKKDEDE